MPTSTSPLGQLGRTWWPWVLLGFGLAVAGLILRNNGGEARQPQPTRPTQPSRPLTPVEPVPLPGGPALPFPISVRVPSGFEQTGAGALEAAIAYVTCGPALLGMDPADADQAVRTMAAAATAEAQAEDLHLRLIALQRALASGSGRLRYHQAAVSARVVSFAPLEARVAVWHVGVLSKAGVAPPQAGWAISVVDLRWEAGDWKLGYETVSPGPAPMLDGSAPPATAEEFDAALAGFTNSASPDGP